MATAPPRTLLLGAAVLAAGLGAWLLSRDEPQREPRSEEARDLSDPAPRGARTRETPPAFGRPGPGGATVAEPTPLPEAGDPVPRILPPDAAIEDLRDALALGDDERGPALQSAFDGAARLAAGSETARSTLRRRIDKLGDVRLRGVATAALGTSPTDANQRWLRTALRDGTNDEMRLGALIALARPAASDEGAAAARSTLLGSLAYPYGPLRDDTRLLGAVARFLDSTNGVAMRDALPIVTASVKASAVYATLLAADGKQAVLWYRTLAPADRDALRTHALRHTNLLPEVRRVLGETK